MVATSMLLITEKMMKAVREGAVAVLPRSHSIVDVFTGKGWGSRSLLGYKQGQLHLIKGEQLTTEQASIVIQAMEAK